jgi:hypothetical protein
MEQIKLGGRHLCARKAMIWQAIDDGVLVLEKVATTDNTADIFTKPLVGEAFARHRATLLGMPYDGTGTVDAGEGGTATGPVAKPKVGKAKAEPATTLGNVNVATALANRAEPKLLSQKAAKSPAKSDHGRAAGSDAITETPGVDKSKTGHGKGEAKKAVTFVSATGGQGRRGGQGRASPAAGAKTEKRR